MPVSDGEIVGARRELGRWECRDGLERSKMWSPDETIACLARLEKATEQKDGTDRARKFCDGGLHALSEEENCAPTLGGPRRRYCERNVQTRRMG